MKPAAILTAIILGLASLSIVAWVGQGPHKKSPLAPLVDSSHNEDQEYGGLSLPKSGPYGQVEIDEKEFNFGTKRVRTASEHNFKLKNVGEGNLTVRLGKPTCQCTGFEITKEGDAAENQKITEAGSEITVAPGESLNVLVKWKMRAANPAFRQVAPLYTTDPKARGIDLVIKGAIDSPIMLLPGPSWEFGEMSLTEPSVAKGAIYSTVYDKFDLSFTPLPGTFSSVSWTPLNEEQLLELSPKEDEEDGKGAPRKPVAGSIVKSGYTLEIKAGPNVPVGYFREALSIECNLDPDNLLAAKKPTAASEEPTAKEPAKKEHDHGDHKHAAADADSDIDAEPDLKLVTPITISGRRSGPIELRGIDSGSKLNIASNRVILGKFPADQGKKAKITLFAKGMEEELVINAVEPADLPVKIKFLGPGKPAGKSKIYDLEVEVPPGPPAKHTENEPLAVSLKLNHPEAADFRMSIDYTSTR